MSQEQMPVDAKQREKEKALAEFQTEPLKNLKKEQAKAQEQFEAMVDQYGPTHDFTKAAEGALEALNELVAEAEE